MVWTSSGLSLDNYRHFRPINCHVIIPVRSGLFMIDSEIVEQFVDDDTLDDAGGTARSGWTLNVALVLAMARSQVA